MTADLGTKTYIKDAVNKMIPVHSYRDISAYG